MIASLFGTLESESPTKVVLAVNNVGYELNVSMKTSEILERSTTKSHFFFTELIVREDAHTLYGFLDEEEREMFRTIVRYVPNVGPKTAMKILSGLSVNDLKQAVKTGSTLKLSKVPGVGPKTAERLIAELKDRIILDLEIPRTPDMPADRAPILMLKDAVSALVGLGYKVSEAKAAVDRAMDSMEPTDPMTVEKLIKQALKK